MSVGPEIAGLADLVEIGRGGFGVVYRARQVRLDRFVAVKVLSTQLLDDRSRNRFEREGRALGTLSGHPNVVGLYEFGITDDAIPYLVLEYLPGGSYADRIASSGPLGIDEASRLIIQVAGALESAHRLGIVHCDLKPENVLIGLLDEPKLGDFGIAQVQGAGTATSSVLASPAHAAPEIIDGRPGTPRSDIYGLGSTLYALLAGRAAFVRPDDSSVFAVLARIAAQDPPDLRGEGVPEPVWSALYWSMAKDPDRRPPSALQFAHQLNAARLELGLPVVAVPVRDAPPVSGSAVGETSAAGAPIPSPRPTPTPAPTPTPTPSGTPTPATVLTPPPGSPSGPPSAARPAQDPVAPTTGARRSRVALPVALGVFAVLVLVAGVAVALRARSGSTGEAGATGAGTVTPAVGAGTTTPSPTTGTATGSVPGVPNVSSAGPVAVPPTTAVEPSAGTAAPMPAAITGYTQSAQPQASTLRVFQSETGGQVLDGFPSGMNHCDDTFWTVRWRSESTSVTVKAFLTGGTVGSPVGVAPTGPTPVDAAEGAIPDASAAGYLAGTFCQQPAFLFGASDDPSNLIDIAVQLTTWRATP